MEAHTAVRFKKSVQSVEHETGQLLASLDVYDVHMAAPLIVRLLLDAQAAFLQAADAVPQTARNDAVGGLNAAGWVVAHAGFFHDVWINVDGQGKSVEECEPWLRAWVRKQDTQRGVPIATTFEDARAAVDRVVDRVTPFLGRLSDADLDEVPAFEEGAWKPGTTLGYLVARDIAHLFAHASELNVISTSNGGADIGLPGRMPHSAGKHA